MISIENRIRNAFIKIGLGDFGSIETMQFIPGWTDFTLNYKMRLDVLSSVKGLEDKSFQELFDAAKIVMIGNLPVKFIDYDNLIITKRATNRPKHIWESRNWKN